MSTARRVIALLALIGAAARAAPPPSAGGGLLPAVRASRMPSTVALQTV